MIIIVTVVMIIISSYFLLLTYFSTLTWTTAQIVIVIFNIDITVIIVIVIINVTIIIVIIAKIIISFCSAFSTLTWVQEKNSTMALNTVSTNLSKIIETLNQIQKHKTSRCQILLFSSLWIRYFANHVCSLVPFSFLNNSHFLSPVCDGIGGLFILTMFGAVIMFYITFKHR